MDLDMWWEFEMGVYGMMKGGLLASAALGLVAVSSTAIAQTAPLTSTDTDGDIVVTANKRAERIQDVALSVTAVSGDDLNKNQLLDIQDLATRVPGLSFQRGGNGPSQRLILRGLNTGGNGATVATVVDDVPLSFSSATTLGADFAADFDPYDLAQVEVLKGPQGSLYGAAAEGGLIKYVTNAPSLTHFGAGFDVGGYTVLHSNDGAGAGASGKAFLNVPLANDVAAFRVSGLYEYGPSWITNNLGHGNANGFKRFGGRASLLVVPTPRLTLRATAIYQQLDQQGYDSVEVYGITTPSRQFDLYNGYNRDTYLPQTNNTKSQLYSLNASYDLGSAQLQSITSYGQLDTRFAVDTPIYGALSGILFGRANTALINDSASVLKKFNQEIRLSSSNGAARTGHGLEWQIGGFYTRETSQFLNNYFTRDITTGQDVVTLLSQLATPPGTPQVFLADLRARYREIAGYADFTYHFSPRFDLNVGGRVFNNKQSFYQSTGGALVSPSAFATSPTAQSSETSGTFSVAPRFHFTRDVMMYARVASGYRPGGPNIAIPAPGVGEPASPPSSYNSDSTINYEAGVKATVFDRMLSFDVAGFYVDWSDIQATVTIPRSATAYTATVNAGKAVSKGIEWNISLTPIRGLNIGWLGAFTDAALKGDVPQINGFNGDRLPYVPEWQTTVTGNYEFDLTGQIKAYLGGSYSRTGARYAGFNLDPTQTHLKIPGYDIWSLQAGVRTKTIGVQIYGKNLGDSRGITSYSGGQTVFGIFVPGTVGLIRPREIGFRLTGAF